MKRRSGTIYLLCLAAINTVAAAVGCSSTPHHYPSLISSYVAAGSLKGNSPGAAWSSFIRDMSASPQLTGTTVSSPTVVPAAGSVIDLKIVKTGGIYTCTYGTEDPAVYTIDLNTKDSAYVYAGLFTARECEVSFSNVDLTLSN